MNDKVRLGKAMIELGEDIAATEENELKFLKTSHDPDGTLRTYWSRGETGNVTMMVQAPETPECVSECFLILDKWIPSKKRKYVKEDHIKITASYEPSEEGEEPACVLTFESPKLWDHKYEMEDLISRFTDILENLECEEGQG